MAVALISQLNECLWWIKRHTVDKERFNSAQDFGANLRLSMRREGFCFCSFNDRYLDLGKDGVKCEFGSVRYTIDTFILKYRGRSVDDLDTLING